MKKCDNEDFLITSAKAGNNDAFGLLVVHYEKFVFNIALSYMSNQDDAFDVAQDSFIKAWQKLRTFKGDSAFSTWLYRICVNTAKDALSKRAKTEYNAEITDTVPDTTATPEETIIRGESVRELHSALNRLDTDMREILILRELDELSYTEIAELLSIEIGTVKSRLSRARERLRQILSEQNRALTVKTNGKGVEQ